MKQTKIQILILTISLILLLSTLGIKQSVYSKEDMVKMRFGYPISFITQDLSRRDPPFPYKYNGFDGSPWEDSFSINWGRFFLSYLCILIPSEIIVFLFLKSKNSSN